MAECPRVSYADIRQAFARQPFPEAGIVAIQNTVQRNRLHSSLFRWMVEHHDDIVEAWNGERINWRTPCAALAELGLTDMRGKPTTKGNARETWRQARCFVTAQVSGLRS
jgi:hypothetical protein